MKEFLVPQPNGPTVAVTTGVAANTAIPTTAGGVRTKYVMLSVELGKEVFISPVVAGSEPADANLMHFSDHMNGLVLNVFGRTHLRTLQKTAAAVVYITPIANG